MSYILEHKIGLMGTLVFHGLILLILLLFVVVTPAPLTGEEGLEVNFGYDNNGLGSEEPAPALLPVTKPNEQKPESQTEKKPTVENDDESIVTQESEKTIVIKPKKEQKQRKTEKIDQEKLKAEAERKQAQAQERKIAEIDNRAKNAFGTTSGLGDPNSKSTSQGVTFKAGNQGDPRGTATSNNYGPGGGIGNGKGVSYNLGGRSALMLPLPAYPGNEEGVVVVKVTVDKNGHVTKAEAGVKGSSTILPELLSAAQKAALQAKFNVDENAPAFQQGTITYHFVLN